MHWFERWLMPPTCVVTGKPSQYFDLHSDIVEGLKQPKDDCPQCGESSIGAKVCGACIAQPPCFERTRIGFYFEGEVIDLVHGLKYQRQLAYARLLAELFIKSECHAQEAKVDALIAVPTHRFRRRERGFNQAERLAENLGKILGVPVLKKVASRVKATPSQTGLSLSKRKQNLQGAFNITELNLNAYNKVALVDDVITTGATMNALAKKLHNAYPHLQIEIWSIAKTRLG